MWKSIIDQLTLQVLDYDSLGTVLSAAPFFLLTGSDANTFLCATSRYAHRPNDKNFPMEWMYSAKHKSHWRPIVGLCFAVPEPGKQQRLFSVGEDRRLVEYSVKSSEFGGLQVGMKPKHSIVFLGKTVLAIFFWSSSMPLCSEKKHKPSQKDLLNMDRTPKNFSLEDPFTIGHNMIRHFLGFHFKFRFMGGS